MNIFQKAIMPLAIAGLCWVGAAAQAGMQSKSNSQQKTAMSSKVTPAERTFLREASQADMAEVQLAQLAEQKASSPEVKQFAQRMVNDHTKNSDQVKQVAQQENVTLPAKLSAKDEATKDRLEKLSGKQFDHAYMLDMVRDHSKDVATFRTESKNATTPAVKSYASQTLPTLESHLKEARGIEPQTARANHSSSAKAS